MVLLCLGIVAGETVRVWGTLRLSIRIRSRVIWSSLIKIWLTRSLMVWRRCAAVIDMDVGWRILRLLCGRVVGQRITASSMLNWTVDSIVCILL